MANKDQLRTAIECVTDCPDDQIEKDGEIVRPGGMGVAGTIANLLRQNSASVSEPVLDFEHGWEFWVERDGRKFWVLVTDLEKSVLIQTRDMSPLLKRLLSGQAAYAAFLQGMYGSLSSDRRFSSVHWVAK